ncbi:MAG: histidine--tRNA ligase [Nanoarchaeota archaeon]|nr:histidine--tRNA ligase [Nanoarchaeota archaeon]
MKTDLVKGFKDYAGQEAQKRAQIKKIIVETFEQYGFEPAETPIIEYEEFVKGNNSQDEAVRDVFKLKDRGKRKLALRYEFTFQLKRLAKNKKLPYKRYQIGPVFRDEPIRPGRTRQFIQCDADIIGSTIKDEAENLSIFKQILEKLKIESIIYINNRKLLNEILDKEKIKEKYKENIIRELDKLDKLSKAEVKNNLKKYNAEFLVEILTKQEKDYENYSSYKEILELKKYCKLFKVEVEFKPFLARGFSYYTGTIFEVWSKKLPVSICGGGSYVINNNQSTGISFGFEPLMLLANLKIQPEKYLVVSLNQDKKAIEIAQTLRKKQKNTTIYYGKPSKALEYANAYDIQKVIFIGEKEIKQNKFKIKDMKTGKEKYISKI